MIENALKLLLTDAGIAQIKKLIKNNSVITLQIALGSGSTRPDKTTTALSAQQEITDPTRLSAINTLENSWHISVHFSPNEKTFAVTEIGLFINEEGVEQTGTLLGIYFSSATIVQKMKTVDLLMDVVVNLEELSKDTLINWKTYQPSFSIPRASTETYGEVKFATLTDVKNKKSGVVLSTDILDDVFDLKVTGKNEQVESWKLVYPTLKADILYAPLGLFTVDNKIYSLFIKDSKESDNKNLLFFTYDTERCVITAEKEISSHDSIAYIESVYSAYEKSKISWLVLKKSSISNEDVWQLETSIPAIAEKCKVTKKNGFSENIQQGSLLFYNQRAGVMGAADKTSKRFLIGNISATLKSHRLSLAYGRKKPLVHVIQDKIYCIGGAVSGQPLVEVHSISFENDTPHHRIFIPDTTTTLDLSDTKGYSTCAFASRIYLFKPANYHKESKDLSFQYYDTLLNYWYKSEIPVNLLKDSTIKPQYGKAVSYDRRIYLFCTQSIEAKMSLSILEFTP